MNPRPRTVNEMAFYIDGVEATIDEKLTAFGERLGKVETALETLKHLLIGSIIAPIFVAIVAAIVLKVSSHA